MTNSLKWGATALVLLGLGIYCANTHQTISAAILIVLGWFCTYKQYTAKD